MTFLLRPLIQSLLLVCACALLGACGAIKASYNYADSLVYWWLDSYVDFTAAQKVVAKDELQKFHHWHRSTQLPVWVGLVKNLQTDIASPVTAEQLCTAWDLMRVQLVPSLSAYLEPQAIWLATNLSADQIKSIEDKYAKINEKWQAEWQPRTKRELVSNTEKSILERTDSLYGHLENDQRKELRALLYLSPFDAKTAYAERLRRQQDLLTTLKDIHTRRLGIDAAREPLRAVLHRSLVSPDPAYLAYAARVTQSQCVLYAKLHNSTNAAQREHALSKLKDYERIFKDWQVGN